MTTIFHKKPIIGNPSTEFKLFSRDLEYNGITIAGKARLAGRLDDSTDWRKDFIFWSRGGATVGIAHIYEGPKDMRAQKEEAIRQTMVDYGFSGGQAKTFLRLVSNPTIMVKAFARGIVSAEQMKTVKEKSLLQKIGDWMSENRLLLDGHIVDLADLRLVRKRIEMNPNTPEAREFLNQAQKPSSHTREKSNEVEHWAGAVGFTGIMANTLFNDDFEKMTRETTNNDYEEFSSRMDEIHRESQENWDAMGNSMTETMDSMMAESIATMDSMSSDSFSGTDYSSDITSSFNDDFGSGSSMSGSDSFGPDF